MNETEQLSFEDALSRLKIIVKELEDDSLPLEKSIELYEEGIELSKICNQTLEEAELRIEKVAKQHAAQNDNE